jgi:hypothetical protein
VKEVLCYLRAATISLHLFLKLGGQSKTLFIFCTSCMKCIYILIKFCNNLNNIKLVVIFYYLIYCHTIIFLVPHRYCVKHLIARYDVASHI